MTAAPRRRDFKTLRNGFYLTYFTFLQEFWRAALLLALTPPRPLPSLPFRRSSSTMDVFETFVKVKLNAIAFLRPQRASHPPLHPAPAKLASTAANSKATGWAPHVLAFGPAVSHEYAFALYLRISVRRCLHRFPCPVHWSLRVLSCILDPYSCILSLFHRTTATKPARGAATWPARKTRWSRPSPSRR